MPRIVHVLWSPQTGPICVYEDRALAWKHAQAMLGVEVSSVELCDELPDFVRLDDDVTPTIVAIEDIANGAEDDWEDW